MCVCAVKFNMRKNVRVAGGAASASVRERRERERERSLNAIRVHHECESLIKRGDHSGHWNGIIGDGSPLGERSHRTADEQSEVYSQHRCADMCACVLGTRVGVMTFHTCWRREKLEVPGLPWRFVREESQVDSSVLSA